MSLITCRECGAKVSSEAKACPSCGAKPKKPAGLAGIVLVLIIGALLFQHFQRDSPATTTQPSAAAAKTPAQLATEQAAADAEKKRYATTASALEFIMKHARNPASVVVELAGASDDASVVCIQYRAQNGFGGMARETVSLVNGKIGSDPKQWNKNCLKGDLVDMMDGVPK
jgi:hypothetical protein